MTPERSSLAWLGVVALVVFACGVVGFGVEWVTGLHRGAAVVTEPSSVLGVAWAGSGIALALWTYAVHPPAVMARATSRTIEILAGRKRESGVSRLLTRGPYRLVRNPLYLAIFLVLSGSAFATGHLGFLFTAVLLLACQRWVFVRGEERELRGRFGSEYDAYRSETARFVPLPRSLGKRAPGLRIILLVVAVAGAVALGSIWGGDAGRIQSSSRGGLGDDLVFAALIHGAFLALALGLVMGWIAAGRLAIARAWGLLAGLLAFGLLVSLYVGPWRVL